jgi:menaquinone-specific isochorismate synthase
MARSRIAALEPFDRGWYAGPVGWFSADEAEFDVAIRSGLLIGRTLRLYTGAGLVRDSDPAAEWDEVEHKLIGLLARLRRDQ